MDQVPGFADIGADDEAPEDYKIKKKSGGGFQSMGLSFNVLKGITKRGYKQPTPIQRQAIPLVLEGKDVVAMARTGSGKTTCFLVPLYERLKARRAKTGARALILSPTRELALQTLKFFKELGRFVGLKAAVILGGDLMDEQFAAIHENPDVIVATPGRFLHVCVEMDLKLASIEYVVFDEADRLFEMGLGEQLTEIMARLPDSRQTVLFSATLPKVLVNFAKMGLSDPVLIRLDVESKIPDTLQLWFITVRPDERLAVLLALLENIIDKDKQTIVFAPTKHHVEYVHMVLDKMGISNTYIYSNLDPTARKINAAKFSKNIAKVLVVTDVAARGIDIPHLDYVINYNFPPKSKLFVHRVGRCARAGRSGTAYSLVAPDEYAYLLDLHLFLGRPLEIVTADNKQGTVGRTPQSLIDVQQSSLQGLHDHNYDLVSMRKVTENAYKQYERTRPAASSESHRRRKELPFQMCAVLHPIFKEHVDEWEEKRQEILDRLKNYRPRATIFEICGKNKSREYQVMKEKRAFHKDMISKFHQKVEQKNAELALLKKDQPATTPPPDVTPEVIDDAFSRVIVPKKRKLDDLYKRTKRVKRQDDTYIPYLPQDKHTEEGLAVNNFEGEASKVQFDLTMDSGDMMRTSVQTKKWDRKKKKMVGLPDKKAGKIRTESGVWIPETYKSNRYAHWKEKSKVADQAADDSDDDESNKSNYKGKSQGPLHTHWAKHNKKMKQKRSELKTSEQILKARKLAEKKKSRQNRRKGGRGKGQAKGKGKK